MTKRKGVKLVCPKCGHDEFEQIVREKIVFGRAFRGSKEIKLCPMDKKGDYEFTCLKCEARFTEGNQLKEEDE